MSMNEIYQLMDKFERSALSEISVEVEGVKFSAKKGCASAVVTPMALTETQVNASIHMEETEKAESAKSSGEEGNAITAPLVGTFYSTPGPGEAPFVEVGTTVKAGDVVGIIEAMKLMNEITAPSDGVVEAILVEDGEMVEFGKPLIRVV